jgi:hypothetical protein
MHLVPVGGNEIVARVKAAVERLAMECKVTRLPKSESPSVSVAARGIYAVLESHGRKLLVGDDD